MLLLTSLPGCAARHMPDGSRVQGVEPGIKIKVQLYENEVPLGGNVSPGRAPEGAHCLCDRIATMVNSSLLAQHLLGPFDPCA